MTNFLVGDLGEGQICALVLAITARLALPGRAQGAARRGGHTQTDAQAALSKSFCTSKCRETVAWAREILGGNGIVADYHVARFFADCEALYSYEGTLQMQNLILGKAITGFSAFV